MFQTAWRLFLLSAIIILASVSSAAPPARPSGKLVTSMADLFEGMPADLQPDPRTGWSNETREKARAWLQKNAANRPCRIIVPINQISYYKKPDKREPGRDWELWILFNSPPFNFHGVNVGYEIQVPPSTKNGEIIYRATDAQEQTARQLDRTRDKIAITGVIQFPRLGIGSSDKHAMIYIKVLNAEIDLKPADKTDAGSKTKQPTDGKPEPDVKAAANAKPFNTWQQMFDGLPADAAPAAGKGWDKTVFRNVSPWFRENAVGREIRLNSRIATISVHKDPLEKDPAQMWVAKIKLADDAFTYRGFEIGTTVYADTIYGFQIRGDEAFGKRMERIQQRHPVTVQGTIRTALIAQGFNGRASITLSLKDYTIPTLK